MTQELTLQDWLSAGYLRYNQKTHNSADFIVQKPVQDEEGKRYYITVSVYEHFNKDYFERNPGLVPISFAPEVQFQMEDKPTVNVSLILNKWSTIEAVEKQFDEMWKALGKPYYRYWG